MTSLAIQLEIDSIIRLVEENAALHPGYADLRNELGLLYAFMGHLDKVQQKSIAEIC